MEHATRGSGVAGQVSELIDTAGYAEITAPCQVVDARYQAEGGTAQNLTLSAARALASQVGVGTIVLGQNERATGGSVQFQAEVLDAETGLVLRLVG